MSSSGVTNRLTYDAFGQRFSETSSSGRKTTTIAGLFDLKMTLAGQAVTYNVYGRNGLVSQTQFAETFSSPALMATTNFVHLDRLGNPDSVTSEDSGTAQLVERGRYEPFGERRSPWAIAHPTAQAAPQSAYGFTGHTPEADSSLINMQGRLYDPRLSRFVSADPIGRPTSQGLNRYSYALNSPLMFTDPSGLDPAGQKIDFPETANPQVSKEPHGFFLHGGRKPGSAGCIDIGGGALGDTTTRQIIRDIIRDHDGVVPLKSVR